MKQINARLFTAGLLLCAGTAQAQWSGTNPITTSSLVDINRSPSCVAALRVHGDVIFKDNCTTNDSILFARPTGENGMSLMNQGGQRADLRYNGTTLKLVTRASGGAPVAGNGISIDNAGHVGLGTDAPKYRLNVNDGTEPDYGAWISANSKGPALWVRRDWEGTWTGDGSTTGYTTSDRYALYVENFDAANINGGGIFTAYNYGVSARAAGRTAGSLAVGVDAWSHSYYTGTTLRWSYGVRAQAEDAVEAYGVQATAAETDSAYGVEGEAYACAKAMGVAGYAEIKGDCFNSTDRAYGVYGKNGGPSIGYAGYFDGDVYASGLYLPSDRRLKENVTDLTDGLATIMKLNPKNYTYSKKDELKTLNLPDGPNHGFIAQELEEVLPELVKDASSPGIKGKDGKVISENVEFKGINYVSLIPYLVAGMKEQQAQIEQLKAQLAAMQNGNGPTKTNHTSLPASQSLLYQNKPNPADGPTVIDYELVNVSSSAYITVFDLNGKQIKRMPLDAGNRKGSVTFSKGELSPGMYYYSLITDGAETQTLRMIIE